MRPKHYRNHSPPSTCSATIHLPLHDRAQVLQLQRALSHQKRKLHHRNRHEREILCWGWISWAEVLLRNLRDLLVPGLQQLRLHLGQISSSRYCPCMLLSLQRPRNHSSMRGKNLLVAWHPHRHKHHRSSQLSEE